ncbi:hypothetical protein V1511DRAFT_459091 [Dipodascopsis uninucleata]
MAFSNNGQGQFDADGVPRPGYLARMYWAVIGAVLAIILLYRLVSKLIEVLKRGKFAGALVSVSSATNILRHAVSCPSPSSKLVHGASGIFSPLPLGRALLAIGYMCLMVAFALYRLKWGSSRLLEKAGYRLAWLTITQLPLLSILSAKRLNVVAIVSGNSSSYNINYMHRWVARAILMTATMHMYFMLRYYTSFNFLTYQLKNDIITRRGFGAWCVLAPTVLIFSIRGFRKYFFEIFYHFHVICAIVFFAAAYKHMPNYAHIYLYIAVGIWAADVLVRFLELLFFNVSRNGFKYRANITASESNEIIVMEIPMKGFSSLSNWYAGQYYTISCPSVEFLSFHPFTPASLSEDNMLRFIIRVKTGFTKKLYTKVIKGDNQGHSYDNGNLEMNSSAQSILSRSCTLPIIICGPYGPSQCYSSYNTIVTITSGVGTGYGFSTIRESLKYSGQSQRNHRMLIILKSAKHLLAYENDICGIISKIHSEGHEKRQLRDRVQIDVYCADGTTLSDGSEKESIWSSINFYTGKPASFQHWVGNSMGIPQEVNTRTALYVCGSSLLCSQIKNDVIHLNLKHSGLTAEYHVHTQNFFI